MVRELLIVGAALALSGCVTDQQAAIQACRADWNPDYIALMTPAERDQLSEAQQRCLVVAQQEARERRERAAAIMAQGMENAGAAWSNQRPLPPVPQPYIPPQTRTTQRNAGGWTTTCQ